ncbi:hypothetical protein GCM10009863_52670 [Streptomyces axinellae]|uniref:Uncharacterized protein n=1 Tax=Streptomyces axinellae TaxID=552788 RepID=A0ABN3QMY7_9ACTN
MSSSVATGNPHTVCDPLTSESACVPGEFARSHAYARPRASRTGGAGPQDCEAGHSRAPLLGLSDRLAGAAPRTLGPGWGHWTMERRRYRTPPHRTQQPPPLRTAYGSFQCVRAAAG